MVVEANLVVRGLLVRWIKDTPGFAVVATVRTGVEASDHLERTAPDVILFDVELPDDDWTSALDFVLATRRCVVVATASRTPRGEVAGRRALAMGAAGCVTKPDAGVGATVSATLRRELIEALHQAVGSVPHGTAVQPAAREANVPPPGGFMIRPFSSIRPRVILIGASTGGPDALQQLVAGLGWVIAQVPVIVVQHMPPAVTTAFAERLARASGHPAREPRDGDPIVPGKLYLAPGGFHTMVRQSAGVPAFTIDDGPSQHFCKPAVDPLFASAVPVYRNAVLAIVLTGMGSDGAKGAVDIVAGGGSVIAQDAATSIVWGMPGAVSNAGLCSAILPLGDIACTIERLVASGRA